MGTAAASGQTPIPSRLSLTEAVALAQARNPQIVAARMVRDYDTRYYRP